MIPKIFNRGDERPYYKALQRPRNKKASKKIYVNQLIRSRVKQAKQAFKKAQ